MGRQDNGKPMPKWEDLSQWMKVMMATMAGGERTFTGFVAAPGEQRASEVVIETERAMKRENDGFHPSRYR
ncbi:hypothetical protein A9D14_01075 [Croceicoccus marinus]|uniref:Uncharacterized protein n=2 Tax=Croceicoccus marinus TaxID=450378 RepID=A0A1Z1F8G4_9SPHN|nr:hypothetical protein A9D14_01075 [Croceicoccus marinus]